MSSITTYTAAALCAAPTFALIQPAQAGAEESHDLAMQYIELNELVSDGLQQLSDNMNKPPVEDLAAIELASFFIRREQVVYELSQETDLSKEARELMRASKTSYQARDKANLINITKTDVKNRSITTQVTLNLINTGAFPDSAEGNATVTWSCTALIMTSYEYIRILLYNINDKESAENIIEVINILNNHIGTIYGHLKFINEAEAAKINKTAENFYKDICAALRKLKEVDYYGNAELREYGQKMLK